MAKSLRKIVSKLTEEVTCLSNNDGLLLGVIHSIHYHRLVLDEAHSIKVLYTP